MGAHAHDSWNRVESVLNEALELKLEDRKSFLEREYAGDLELRREVESLLASVDKSLGFLEAPLHEIARQLAVESEAPGAASRPMSC